MFRRTPKLSVLLACVVTTALLLAGCSSAAKSKAFPNKPIELVVPYPPGGISDIVGRAVASSMSDTLGQPVVVVNKPGASGMTGAEYMARSKAAGYSIAVLSPPNYYPELFQKGTTYTFNDLVPVAATHVTLSTIVVKADSKWKTLKELLDYAKTKPISIGNTGVGATTHLVPAQLAKIAGAQVTHVPFNGDATAIAAVLGGHIEAACVNYPGAQAQIEAKQLRALGIFLDKRMDSAKDIPTLDEQGYKLTIPLPLAGIFTSKDAPPEAITKLDEAVKKALEHAGTKAILQKSGVYIMYVGQEEFSDMLSTRKDALKRAIEDAGALK